MKSTIIVAACFAAVAAIALNSGGPASAETLKACNDEWNAMKKANQTGDKKYADFRKECLAKPATAATTTPATTPVAKPAAKPAAKTTTTTTTPATTTTTAPATTTAAKPADGRQAMYARERACAADWKADKAAGKVEKGMTWPKYWSACNTRKKAEGM